MISCFFYVGRQVGVMSNWFVQSPNDTRSCRRTVDGSAFNDFSASSMLAIIGRQVGVMSNWVLMIRDLAEETVDGSAFDDFSASSLLAIIGRQVGVMCNWFAQGHNDTRSCRRNS